MKTTLLTLLALIGVTTWASPAPFPEEIHNRFVLLENRATALEGDTITVDSIVWATNGDILSNGTDDVLDFLSDDASSSIRSTGYEGMDAVLQLWADQGDDAADKYSLTSSDSTNNLLLKNGSTTLQTLSSSGDVIFAGTTPYLTLGDAGAEDAGLVYDGNAVDFNISLDDSEDKLVIGLGSAAGTTNRFAFNSADLNMVLGDASAADVGFIYDGNAQDFNISLDDSTDDLVIGLGAVAGTTDAIRIDENQNVTFVQNVLGLGTDSVSGFLQKQVAATATTITAAQCGSTFVNAGAIEMELPEASTVLGCRLTFIVGNASAFTIDPDAADSVVLLTNAAGDSLIADAIGESLVIEAISASAWAPVGAEKGTWTDSD